MWKPTGQQFRRIGASAQRLGTSKGLETMGEVNTCQEAKERIRELQWQMGIQDQRQQRIPPHPPQWIEGVADFEAGMRPKWLPRRPRDTRV